MSEERKYSLISVVDLDAIRDEEVDEDITARRRISDREVSRHGNFDNSGMFVHEDGPSSEEDLEEEIVGQPFPPEGSGEIFVFDKFVNDLEARQHAERLRRAKLDEGANETGQRKYIKRYREHPHNRMKVGK